MSSFYVGSSSHTKFYVLNDSAVEFVLVFTGHPISSRTAKNDVPSGHHTAVHSAVANPVMHLGIHSMNKDVVNNKRWQI